MKTTEAEILAAFAGSKTLRLNNQFPALWKRMPELGYIMALTRNESCVHERKGIFENVHTDNPHVGFVVGKDIDLRMFFRQWAFGFAVFDDKEAGFKKSIQVFDHQGTAVIKIFLQEQSDHEAFEKLVRDFSDPEQTTSLLLKPQPDPHIYDDAHINTEDFRRSWSELKDTHDFFPMLRNYNISRLHALHIAGDFARRVYNDSATKLLYDAAEKEMEIMVFTGNHGNIQIHTGTVKNIVAIPGWINVMDPAFNLHLRTDHIAESWLVKKPTSDGMVHSLELYDAQGNTIVQFFGKRKPGLPESEVWQEYANRL